MSVTNGYIIGYPAAADPDERPRGRAVKTGRTGVKARRRSRHQILTGQVALGLYLPAITERASLTGWIRAYGQGLRVLFRSMPRLERITITFRSGMSFLDQVVPALLLGRFYGTKVVLRYRSNKAEAELESYGRTLLPFLRLADRIEVACGHTERIFASYGFGTVVRPEMVDADTFSPRRRSTVQPSIVIARRLERGNGLTMALKAFGLVKMKYPRAELTIMGDGPQRADLEALVEAERIFGVAFAGDVTREEVARRMSSADVYLNASTMDGLPLSLLEAMTAGLVIVTTDAGDIATVVKDRYNGLITPSNSAAALADRMIELVEKPELVDRLSAEAARSAALRHRSGSTIESDRAA